MLPAQSIRHPLLLLALAVVFGFGWFSRQEEPGADQVHRTQRQAFRVERVTGGLEHPWSVAFLPDGRMLITERPGRLRIVESDGSLTPHPVAGLPAITATGQGGLMEVTPHPDFTDNGWIYLSYAASDAAGNIGTEVARGKLRNHTLKAVEVLFQALPKSKGGRHFGSRLLFDKAKLLYITVGERGDRDRAQDLGDHAGSVIRLQADGSVPEGNPFVGKADAKPEIFTYGNRNVQGIAMHPETGAIWAHEHGPQGGDEVNILRPGANYGWPVITYGVNYVFATPIGAGTEKPGMEQPIHYWVPSIAPSGMAFYTSDRFPPWRGNLFVGALKHQSLVRLEIEGDEVVGEERLLQGLYGRIRDVRQGPDDYLYFLTDASDGGLYRLLPAD